MKNSNNTNKSSDKKAEYDVPSTSAANLGTPIDRQPSPLTIVSTEIIPGIPRDATMSVDGSNLHQPALEQRGGVCSNPSPHQGGGHTQLVDVSDTSLDALIPSFPGSPRQVNSVESQDSSSSSKNPVLHRIIKFLHDDNEFLSAIECENLKLLQVLIDNGVDVHQKDLIGRNGLHFAVCCRNPKILELVMKTGIDPNLKDNVGMTPLSICLFRCPSVHTAKLLFDYGAIITDRRTSNVDIGLFLQFVMMCEPTQDEENIIRLLVTKGAKLEDPEAPGGRQALHFAAMSNNCILIKLLVDLGANLYNRNHRNETPKEVAIAFKSKEAQFLLEGIEINRLLKRPTIMVPSRRSKRNTRI